MKKLHQGMLWALLCLTFCFSSCFQTRNAFSGVFTPNCKQFGVGSVCFQNPSKKTTTVEMKGYKIEILPFSMLCLDLYEGEYEYKAKNKNDKWKAEFDIVRCREQKVALEKCKNC